MKKKILARRESQYVEQQKNKTNIESGLKNLANNLFLQKSVIGFVKVTQMNQEVQETEQEKRHSIFLENN